MPSACAPCPGKRNAMRDMATSCDSSQPQAGAPATGWRRPVAGAPGWGASDGVGVGGRLLLLFLFLFHDDHGAVLVEAAVGTDAVRQHGVAALRAVLDLQRLDVLVAP